MSLYMPEMTNLQVREYVERGGRWVIVPVGSTEDHGDHGPLWTDVYIPLEVAKRVAEEIPGLVDMERARDFTPDLGELRTNPFALLDPLFQSTPGSFWTLLEQGGGVWGAPSESTAEKGETFLNWAAEAVVNLLRDMEQLHDRLEPGYRRKPGDALR